MSSIYFQPWVGCDFESGGVFNYKILAVGDSHYCSDECPLKDKTLCGIAGNTSHFKMRKCSNFTKNVVQNYIDNRGNHLGRWTRTYTVFTKALAGGRESQLDIKTVWNSIAFYNFVQSNFQYGPRESYMSKLFRGKDLYQASLPAFEKVVARLSPDFIIVWGHNAWKTITDNNPSGLKCLGFLDSGLSPSDLKPIDKKTGKKTGDYADIPIAMKITHPSSNRFGYAKIEPLFRNFIRISGDE